MKLHEQVTKGLLVSPKTRKILEYDEDNSHLITKDRTEDFLVKNEIPFLLKQAIDERFANKDMDKEYRDVNKSFFEKIKDFIYGQMFSPQVIEIQKSFDKYTDHNLVLSIGGGPKRNHPSMTNVNISDYPNVDIIADAHELPYADNSVDAIYIEAVIEHLYNPLQAISEMYRVLKPGGIVFSLTPFMQPYHGYPHHYQNLTLTGHEYYFTSKGFKLLSSGTAVGPTVALIIINSKYILNYFPPIINKIFGAIFLVFCMIFLKPLDLFLNKKQNSHILCSETFVYVQK